eukprot:659968-Amphidinium_carterae.4
MHPSLFIACVHLNSQVRSLQCACVDDVFWIGREGDRAHMRSTRAATSGSLAASRPPPLPPTVSHYAFTLLQRLCAWHLQVHVACEIRVKVREMF